VLSLADQAIAKDTINSHPLKVGFIMVSTLNDFGWEDSRQQLS